MNRPIRRLASAALSSGLVAISTAPAFADGTSAGVSIENTATVGYSLGGVVQPDVDSTTASFLVDMLVNFVVAELGGAETTVTPGASDQVSTFTITNTSNAVLDFSLAASQSANGAGTAFGGTDGGDATNVRIFVDANGNNTYDPGTDTDTYVDQLAADASVTAFVVADIPTGLADNVAIGVTLSATVAAGDVADALGALLVETAGADTPGAVDTVFGDAAGAGDGAGDGVFGANDAYFIDAATLLVTKIARIISDPFNGATNPKSVPGSVIEYCIQLSNTGSAAAADVVITDTLPAETTFQTGSIKSHGTVTGGACNADGVAEDDDAADGDESDPAGGSFSAGVVTVSIPVIAAGQTLTALFRAVID